MTFYVQGLGVHELMPIVRIFKEPVVLEWWWVPRLAELLGWVSGDGYKISAFGG